MAARSNNSSAALQWFSKALLPWYREHFRDLPWRRTTDPYRIWLSEVILQQTRVDQGMAYWHRFVERYPTVADLASAPEDDVLKLWQGLGYYSRARNLRTAAQQVMDDHQGQFPRTYEALKQLKGVGEYTAAAIGSISFNLPEPVVDGNVYRVLARVFGLDLPIDSTEGKKVFRSLAADLLDPTHPGDHNQAVMELGATVCTPKNPLCETCPIATKCIAKATDRITELPVKANRTAVRTRHFNYLHITTKQGTYLRKRKGKGIWEGLYEFPQIESEKDLCTNRFAALLERTYGKGWKLTNSYGPVKHVLSHQLIRATFWTAIPPLGFAVTAEWVLVPKAKMTDYAVPRLVERYLGEGL
ncbi:MAG: A/G-specific adenine glycosylase [Flavobacteriales bacterium]|nr:A/G-specific adenine glycosylase [Flavobacteriales bacterium]